MAVVRKSLPVFFLTILVTLAQAAPQRIRQAIDNAQTTVLRGNIPHLARAEFDRGPVSPALRIQGASIVFNRSPAQQADAERFLAQLQNPASPNYHKWLTPQQYADRFGMSQADIDKVAAWLQSRGLHIDRVTNSRTQIYFSGTAAQIQAALHTQLHQFVQNGETHFANATEPALPAALAESVLAVRNLNSFRPRPRKISVRKVPSAQPHFTSGGGSHFISPDDLATIYNIKPLYDLGITGESPIAVVGQTQINQADITAFRSAAGLPSNPFQAVLVPGSGTSTVSTDDVLEADLDVEWSGAVAKNAPILFVYTGNGTNFNVIDALQYAVDQNLAPVISISYGLCEASAGTSGKTFLQQLAQQAVMQMQTISSASGDEGAADCEDSTANSAILGLAVDMPSAIPEVTGVGGSEFSGDVNNGATYWNPVNDSHNASALAYIPETAWNDTAQTVAASKGFSAGGGGQSSFFAKPTYQQGIAGVPAADHRYVPDISLNASAHHDGYLVCSQGNCTNGFVGSDNSLLLVGGTSVGAPVFAGLVGLINQATQSSGQGNVNPTLYQLSASTSIAFHDITTGDNKVPCTTGKPNCPTGTTSIGYSAAAGYDLATGLGSLDMFNLVSAWPGFSTTAAYTITANPSTIAIASAGKSGTSTLTVTTTSGFTGTVSLACTPPPSQEISCSVSPSSVDLTLTTSSTTATLTVSTTAAHAASTTSTASTRGSSWFATAALMFAGVFALVIPSRRRRPGVALTVLLVAFLFVGVGCGGGSSTPAPSTPTTPTDSGTASGSYTVVIKGTSGTVTRAANIEVTVP